MESEEFQGTVSVNDQNTGTGKTEYVQITVSKLNQQN